MVLKNRTEALVLREAVACNPNSPFIHEYLAQFDDKTLFNIGLHYEHWNIIKEVVEDDDPVYKRPNPFPLKFAENSPWRCMPLEMWLRLLKYADVQALFHLGETCKWFHRVVHDEYNKFMTQAFDAVDLDWQSLRFMLVSTEALLAGWAAHRMLFPGATRFMFHGLEHIDIFVRKDNTAQIRTYFDRITNWSQVSGATGLHPYITETIYYSRANAAPSDVQIALHFISKESPRCTIFRFPLSAQFVHFDGRSIVVPYSALSVRGLAIPNRLYMPLQNGEIRELDEVEQVANKHAVHLCVPGPNPDTFSRYHGVQSTLGDNCRTFILKDRGWWSDERINVPRYATVWNLPSLFQPTDSEFSFFVHCVPLINVFKDDYNPWLARYKQTLSAGVAIT